MRTFVNDITFGMDSKGRKRPEMGETLVMEHLLSQGYKLLARNYHCRNGEEFDHAG